MVELVLSVTAILALVIGVIILVWPKVINYAIAFWLIIYGLLQIFSGYF